jgi:chorismate mutase
MAFNPLYLIRYKIDRIDDTIYELLRVRMKYAKKTTPFKTTVQSTEREQYILNRLKDRKGLDKDFVEAVWQPIFNYSRVIQAVKSD